LAPTAQTSFLLGPASAAHRRVFQRGKLYVSEILNFLGPAAPITNITASQIESYRQQAAAQKLRYKTCWIERRQGQDGFDGTPAGLRRQTSTSRR
jgi:hypothetical protein